MDAAASVIVRSWNKERTIEKTLSALRGQTVPVEIIVVDSGSTDATLRIARRYADVVVELPHENFTFGRALNIGADASSRPVHMALSAHCVPTFPTWVEHSVAHFARPDVAATNGADVDGRGQPIVGVHYQRALDARIQPRWGFSNHGSAWRATVWEAHPFREDLVACEDKEWSWRVLEAGWTIAFDPVLQVPATHRRAAGFRQLWARHRLEAAALAGLGVLPRPSYPDLYRLWRDLERRPSRYPHAVRMIRPSRLVELHGDFAGARAPRFAPPAGPDRDEQNAAGSSGFSA